jgi:hypothetical protein
MIVVIFNLFRIYPFLYSPSVLFYYFSAWVSKRPFCAFSLRSQYPSVSVTIHDYRKFGKFFCIINNSITKAGIFHPAVVVKLLPRFGDGALVCIAGHSYSSCQDAQIVYRIE